MSQDDQSPDQAALADKALQLLRSNEQPPHHPAAGDHPDDGKQSIPRADQPPSGALDAEGHRPVLERSRKVR